MNVAFNFNLWKRIVFSFVALLLSFVLICTSLPVFADSDNSMDIYELSSFIALCGACGVTFTSVNQAQNFYDELVRSEGGGSASFSDFDDMIDAMADYLENVADLDGKIIEFSLFDEYVSFLKNFGEMIANKFGLSDNVYIKSVHVPSNGLDMNNTDDRIVFKIPIISNEITSTIIGNLKIYALWGSMKSHFDFTNELSENSIYPTSTIFYCDICDGLFEGRTYQNLTGSYSSFYYDCDLRWSAYGSTYNTIVNISSIIYSYYSDGLLRFNGNSLNNEFVDGIYRRYFTASGNIVDTSTGCLRGTNIQVPIDVVNRGGLWYDWEFAIFLNDLIFDGNSANIDTAFLPGGDIPEFDVAYADIDRDYFDNTSAPVVLPPFSVDDNNLTLSDTDISAFTPFSARGSAEISPDLSFRLDGDINATVPTGSGGSNVNVNIPENDTPSEIVSNLSLPEIIFTTKFPFCLPYDIYAMCLGLRSDDAEPPVFSIPYKNDTLNIDLEYTIDFDDFNEPITILRFFIGAIFTVGLIFATRKLIWK